MDFPQTFTTQINNFVNSYIKNRVYGTLMKRMYGTNGSVSVTNSPLPAYGISIDIKYDIL